MAVTVTSTLAFGLGATEGLDAMTLPSLTQRNLQSAGFPFSVTLNATSVPPGSLYSAFQITGAGSGTIDLTSLQSTHGTMTALGLTLRGIAIQNTGATPFQIKAGASNPYPIGTNHVVVVAPGGYDQKYFAAGLAAVGSGAKTLDWTGNAADTYNIALLFG
jgi:hypothetical protein